MKKAVLSSTSQVPFVSVNNMKNLIANLGIESFLLGLVEYLEQDFKRWQVFEKSPRFASHSRDGVIELMPTSNGDNFACKYVNGHPKNTLQGLQTVTAFGVLADVDSGYPILLTEMTLLTALRTAATSAMVAKYLAPKQAKTLTLIGNGAQSEFQALAFKAVLGISHVKLYDVDANATSKCYANLREQGFTIEICTSAKEAIKGADIITTCTADKKNATILSNEMVADGVHINAIGGDCPGKTELDQQLLLRAEVFVEYEAQTRIEGDIQQLPASFKVTEFHQVLNKTALGRVDHQQITIFDGVGFAIEDFSALRYLYQLLEHTNEFEHLELLANPDDPRNLFGVLSVSMTTEEVK